MRFHDELNPKLWNNFELKEEVKDKLEEITEAFIEYLDIPAESILDVQITGSSANYNYTEYSDLDLHLIVDYEKVHKECPIVEGYLWSMKSAFNKEHDISIYGIQVEVYAEDSRQSAISNGVYSLLNDEWIKRPEKIPPTENDAAVEAKYNEIKDIVDKLDDSEEAEEILNKVYEMRKAGLSKEGEYSTENLAFKKLRNEGYIDKLKQLKKQNIDKQLTLESYHKGYKIGDKITIDGKQGVIDSLFSLQDDNSLLGAWVKFNNDVKYYTIQELNNNKYIEEDYEWYGTVALITFDNGEVLETAINGTDEEIKSYYLGKTFNLGIEKDDMHKVVKVEVIRESKSIKELNEQIEKLLKELSTCTQEV